MMDVGSSSRTVIGASSKRCSEGELGRKISVGYLRRTRTKVDLRGVLQVRKSGHRFSHPAQTRIANEGTDDRATLGAVMHAVFAF